jgi:hypothetical protein
MLEGVEEELISSAGNLFEFCEPLEAGPRN